LNPWTLDPLNPDISKRVYGKSRSDLKFIGTEFVMNETLKAVLPHVIGVSVFIISCIASAHVVLNKRDTRAAVGWVGLIWLVPVIGALLYILLGINRIRRRAKDLRPEHAYSSSGKGSSGSDNIDIPLQFTGFSTLVHTILHKPLLKGNAFQPLVNGDEAFPAMIREIDRAEHSIHMMTYIFDRDSAGKQFVEALVRAVRRGVKVRIIIDDVGARYSFPPVTRLLRRSGINVARFLPTMLPWRTHYINLRNHRKILVLDGTKGFTGGMNIRNGLMLKENPKHPFQDLHFFVEGPVVAHLKEVFLSDWEFCTGERLEPDAFPFPSETSGTTIARGIPDGPDEDFEKLQWIVHGALMAARSSVRIVTPYFIPDSALIKTINLTALRGIKVDIVLPAENNLPLIKWASMDVLQQILEHGSRIWLTPPPFDHSKLMVVDDAWTLLGSANWDTRSFRLNFEFNVECYDPGLAEQLNQIINAKIEHAHNVTRDEVNKRTFLVKLRDGIARLFSPYL
jgi:cardiolipin synthase